jgi:hypothetical protein
MRVRVPLLFHIQAYRTYTHSVVHTYIHTRMHTPSTSPPRALVARLDGLRASSEEWRDAWDVIPGSPDYDALRWVMADLDQ